MDYTWGTELQQKTKDCIKPDDVEYKVMEAAIFALNPYDEFSWIKYFESTRVMDGFNWAPCFKDKEIWEATQKISKEWDGYWMQKDIKKIV